MQPLKMFSKTFMIENAHHRMLNGTELNLGEGTRGLIRAGWAVGPAADMRRGAWKWEKRGALLGAPISSTIWGLFVASDKILYCCLLVSENEFGELQECSLTEKEHFGEHQHLNDLTLSQQEGLDQCNVFLNTVK